jgi:membrane protease YdiL (CAAX protease family)
MSSTATESSIDDVRGTIFGRLWNKVPLPARAIITGFLVFEILQLGQALILLNLEFLPAVPWVVPLILLFLFVGWRYFGGWGWPRTTQETRRQSLRIGNSTEKTRLWGYATAIVVLAHLAGLAVVLSSVVQFPEASFKPPDFISELSQLTAFALILSYSLVAGVSEEAGFRGYMLVPLENRFGTIKAVIVVALIFWLAHFSSASFLHRFPLLFGAGLYAGFLASYSKSLGPPIALHFIADAIGFTTVAGLFGLPTLYTAQTIWATGPTPLFWQALALTVVGGLASIAMLVKMSKIEN